MGEFVPADQSRRDAALDPARSVIVQAPAGSGKTGLLTQRFLRLLALVRQPEEIVAITFTRKAAAEMRERILDAMRAAATGELPGNAGANARRTHEFAGAALARDREHGWGVLANPSRLRILTIDAFNAMLTRQMPLTSQFGQQPGIAEDGMRACRNAAHRLFTMAGASDEPGPALRTLLAHLDNHLADATGLVAMMLARRDLWLRHLDVHGLDRETLEANLADEVSAVLRALHAALPPGLLDAAMAIARRAREYLLAGDVVTEKNAWVVELGAIETAPIGDAQDLATWQRLRHFLLTRDGRPRKAGGLKIDCGFPPKSAAYLEAGQADAHKAAMTQLLATLEDAPAAVAMLDRVEQLPLPRYTDEQWRVLDAINALLPHAVVCLQEEFRDGGEVDFAELAIRARDALGDDDNATDLAMRLDYQVRHLLVDEFQDTSHSQIDLLLRLTRGWEPGDGRSLFLVGDPMQSIYAFREAEVGHFLAVRDHGLGLLQLESLRLSANFRSQSGVVNWVNQAFGGTGGARIFPVEDQPAVGAIAYESSEPALAELAGEAVTVHAFGQDENAAEAARVVSLVQQGLDDPDNESTAILVRGRRHLAGILPALRAANIPFRAVELESLEEQPEIQDLFALTRAVINPTDVTALYSACRAPWCGLSLAALQALSESGQAPWRALLDADWRERALPGNDARVMRLADALQKAWETRGRRRVRERVEGAWFALGGPAMLREADQRDNAMLFFELLQQLEEAGDLDDVNELDARLASLYAAPDPGASESVQIMTLHKAKGLEFDTVIIPALDRVPKQQDRLLFHWIERPGAHGEDRVLLGPLRSRSDEEGGAIYRFIERLRNEKSDHELARLLYVGVTRAKRRVHLLAKARFGRRKDGTVELANPPRGSLLEMLWPLPQVRTAFEAVALPDDEPEHATAVRTPVTLARVVAEWRPPAIPAGPASNVRETDIASGGERLVYDWAGDRVRHTGTLVHRMLQRIAQDGLARWNADRVAALPLEARLRAMGLPDADCAPAAADARAALQKALASERGRWLLADHAEARCEWSLGGIDGRERVNVSIDRSFVDAEGVRWIIDYKTSRHEGGDTAQFLADQRERYRAQLERYARLVRALDKRPVKVALYFPVQDVLTSWEPELD